MKKILGVIFAVLFFAICSYAENWDSDVISVYEMEQNGNDDTGTYNLVGVGTPTYSMDHKYGSYSQTNASHNNCWRFSGGLQDALAALSQWCIEGWVYRPESGSNVWVTFVSNNWTELGAIYRRDDDRLFSWYDGAEVQSTITGLTEDWHHTAIDWTGTQAKFYVDGALIRTANDTDNVFNGYSTYTYIGQGIYGDTYNTGGRVDRVIVSKVARAGVETTPVAASPTVTPTYTITQTATDTVTPTVTETVTDTVTETVTPTVTETVTPTVTETATPTATPTITPTYTATPTFTATPWPDYILNAPKAKDPHYQGPRFRWVDKVLNAIRNRER